MKYVYGLPVPSDLDGTGIRVAILDTGIVRHPDFDQRILIFKDFVHGQKSIYDDNGHGTHVAGILAGNGTAGKNQIRGIAPGVQILALKVLDGKGNGSLKHILKALDWLLLYHRKFHIRIINISIGTIPDRDTGEGSEFMKKLDLLWDQGICIFAAAGNAGPEKGSVTSPGINRKLITVGCCESFPLYIDRWNTRTQYSGRGPVEGNCVVKPEIVAYGKNILSCNHMYLYGQKPYIQKSGTSMAVPMAAGSAALLLQKYPMLSNGQVKFCFHESSRKLSIPRNQQGWGLIQPVDLIAAGDLLVSKRLP